MLILKKADIDVVCGAKQEIPCKVVNCNHYDYFSAISAKVAVCVSIGKIGKYAGTYGMISGFMLCMGYSIGSIYTKYKNGYTHVYSGKSCKLV